MEGVMEACCIARVLTMCADWFIKTLQQCLCFKYT